MSRTTTRIPLALVAGLLACASPHAAREGASAGGPPGEVLARGNGFAITAAEFRKHLANQSETVRARTSTPETRKEFLDNLVRFEVLVVEARRLGYEQDPRVRDVLEKVIVQQLVRDRFSPRDGEKGTSEQKEAFERLVQSLLAQANVEVDAKALEALGADAGEPAGAPEAK